MASASTLHPSQRYSMFSEQIDYKKVILESQRFDLPTDFAYTATHYNAVVSDLNTTLAVLKKRAKKDKTQFQKNAYHEKMTLWARHLSKELDAYHRAYGQPSEAAQYASLQKEIDDLTSDKKINKAKAYTFLQHMGQTVADSLADMASTPKHTSKMRNWLSLINIWRIFWVFCRLTLTEVFLSLKNSSFIKSLDAWLGQHTDFDEIIKNMKAPNAVLYVMSVGIFVLRFIISAAMILKHTFFPTKDEEALSQYQRFMFELKKRRFIIANDLFWAFGNGLTNYASYFSISDPLAMGLLAAFMLFDVALVLVRRHYDKKDYELKRQQYDYEYEHAEDEDERAFIAEQRKELDISWKASNANYAFNASAALLLMMGFTASLLITIPALIPICYLVCTIGVGMYLSDGAFKTYREKAWRMTLDKAETPEMQQLQSKELSEARKEFALTLIKNTLVPMIMVATLAICWQVAVILAVSYAVYGLVQAYRNHQEQNEPDDPLITHNPALPSPAA